MSVRRAQAEIDSAEFTEWLALWRLRAEEAMHGVMPAPTPTRTDEDLLAAAIAWRDRVNARPN